MSSIALIVYRDLGFFRSRLYSVIQMGHTAVRSGGFKGGRIYVEVVYSPRPFGHYATTLNSTRARMLGLHNDLAVLNDLTLFKHPAIRRIYRETVTLQSSYSMYCLIRVAPLAGSPVCRFRSLRLSDRLVDLCCLYPSA